MHHVLKQKIGMDKGVLKVKFTDDTVCPTTLEDLLLFVKEYLSTKQTFEAEDGSKNQEFPTVSCQVFSYGHHTEHVYGLKKLESQAAVPHSRKFLTKYLRCSAFNTPMCSDCKVSLDSGVHALLEHYWAHIRQESEMSSGMEFSDDEMDLQSILEEGKLLRQKYFRNLGQEEKSCDQTEQSDESGNTAQVHNFKLKRRSHILYCCDVPVESKQFFITPTFSLSKLETILDCYPRRVPGLSYPYLYVGTAHASFAYHIEDAALFSINCLHYGAPCVWFFIPPQFFKRFSEWSRYFNLDLSILSCSNGVGSGHKYVMASAQFLKKLGIPVHVVIQRQRELIITYPFAAHSGFKCGVNVQEAANFADEWWAEPAILAPKCDCESYLVNMDLKEILAVCRPLLAVKYVNRDFVGIYRMLAKNEFVQSLQLLPSLLPSSEPETSQVNPLNKGDVVGVQQEEKEREDEEKDAQNEERKSNYQGSRVALVCPEPGCMKTFAGGRSKIYRLKDHMQNKHNATSSQIKKLDVLYPRKDVFKTKRLVCDLCGEMKAGGNTAMKIHKKKCLKFDKNKFL